MDGKVNPIKPTRKHWTHAALPLLAVATFAGIVVVITLFASHGPVTGAGASSGYGAQRGNELVAQSTFHTGDLIVDNTSKFGGKMQIGAIVPGASQQAWFSLQSASTTTQLWIQEDDTGHTGSGGNNESINQVYRNFTGFAMGSAGTATAGAIDIHVNASKTSGSGTLETLAILSTAEGGDDNFDYLSLGGTMKHVAGPALFADVSTANLTTGGTLADLSASTGIKLNQNITSPKNAIPGDTTDTPQLAIGLTATTNDGTGLQIKNTNGAQGLSGIDLLADTAVNGNQSTGVFMTRGNGGGGGAAGNNPAGIGLIGNAGSIISNGSVGDMAVYNQVAGGRLIFGADAVHADYQMALDQTGTLTVGATGTGTIVSTNLTVGSGGSGQVQIGPTVPSSSQDILITLAHATDTAQAWIQSDDINHVGSLGNNEMIQLVLRNNTTFNTTANAGHASAIDIVVDGTIASGSNSLENIGIAIAGHGSGSNVSNYAIKSTDVVATPSMTARRN